jgi:hypothetical protein
MVVVVHFMKAKLYFMLVLICLTHEGRPVKFRMIFVVFCGVFWGCTVSHHGDIKGVRPFPPLAATKCTETLKMAVDFKFLAPQMLDGRRAGISDRIELIIGDRFTKSGCFEMVNDAKSADLVLNLRVREEGRYNYANQVITGLTLGLVPSFARDDYWVVAEIYDGDTQIVNYKAEHQARYVYQLFLVFGMPFQKGPMKKWYEIWADMADEIAAHTIVAKWD